MNELSPYPPPFGRKLLQNGLNWRISQPSVPWVVAVFHILWSLGAFAGLRYPRLISWPCLALKAQSAMKEKFMILSCMLTDLEPFRLPTAFSNCSKIARFVFFVNHCNSGLDFAASRCYCWQLAQQRCLKWIVSAWSPRINDHPWHSGGRFLCLDIVT